MREPTSRTRLNKWEAVGGVVCFVAGIVAPIVGMLLLAIEWLAGRVVHPWLHFTGTTLLIVGIPLILFAGFCLDWAEAGQKKAAHNRAHNQRGVARLIQIATIATLCGGAYVVNGQQTIFNVPTTDVLNKGKVYVELATTLIDGSRCER